MENIARGVLGLRIGFVNVFAVQHSDRAWTLIDAGLPFSEPLIRKWAEKNFASAPDAIVLTHGHFDHVGAARTLAEKWKVPVYAHSLEFPYLTGKLEYPAPNPGAGGGLMTVLSPIYPRGPIDLGEHLVEMTESSEFTALPGWQVLHTPGHTPGHVSLYRREDRLLLVGDAFCTTKPESFFEAALAQQPELHGPPAYFTWDWDQAGQSVARLAALNPTIVAPGHGRPLSGAELPDALQKLAAQFGEVAVPENRQ